MNNIILIGMPGSGKSTIGMAFSKKFNYNFIDSDCVIEEKEHLYINEIIKKRSVSDFIALENRINQQIQCDKSIISTGGSAVYGKEAMAHFKTIGTVIYLKLNLDALKIRLGDYSERGIAMESNQTLDDIYKERIPLYEKYADITVSCDDKSVDVLVDEISANLF